MKQLGELKKEPNGLYLDHNKRHLLIDFRQKKIHVVPKEKMRMIQLFRSRYVVALMIMIILSSYVKWPYALAGGLISAALLEISRQQYINTLNELKNYEIPEEQDMLTAYSHDPVKVNQKRAFASFALVAIIIGSGIYFYKLRNPDGFVFNFDNCLLIILEIVFIFIGIRNGITAVKALQIQKDKQK